jgi:hypothetical protein
MPWHDLHCISLPCLAFPWLSMPCLAFPCHAMSLISMPFLTPCMPCQSIHNIILN